MPLNLPPPSSCPRSLHRPYHPQAELYTLVEGGANSSPDPAKAPFFGARLTLSPFATALRKNAREWRTGEDLEKESRSEGTDDGADLRQEKLAYLDDAFVSLPSPLQVLPTPLTLVFIPILIPVRLIPEVQNPPRQAP
ncbi:hypothetical protein H0H81_006757 [Sphagnurus paluster]|uniref:Uncharacterized protein n=1 Tax=Sphagnurus paluster TaxID=117069 RepID=A0A9P7FQS2_9AGAR|nr:hypothetical protein H0H81_006757 [Sphagnurus paluster]